MQLCIENNNIINNIINAYRDIEFHPLRNSIERLCWLSKFTIGCIYNMINILRSNWRDIFVKQMFTRTDNVERDF